MIDGGAPFGSSTFSVDQNPLAVAAYIMGKHVLRQQTSYFLTTFCS
jgi:hypothetical protein